MSESWGFETKQVHAGAAPDPTTGARAVPIYQTTSYVFRDTAHAAALFGLEELGNIYTRIMNPTQAVFEDRVSRARRRRGCAGDVERPGRAVRRAARTSPRTAATSCRRRRSTAAPTTSSTTRSRSWASRSASSTTPTTSTRGAPRSDPTPGRSTARRIGNPKGDVFDFDGVSAIAHEHTVPLVIDNTLASPYLCRPLEHGADIVVHSATKFIGGHGTSIGGIIVDGGKFDYAGSGRFANFTEPDPSYHGAIFSQLPEPLRPAQYILKARLQYLRDIGPAISPFNSFLFLQGLETLSLRMERHTSERARGRAVARGARRGRVGAATPGWRRARGTTGRSSTCPTGRARSSPSASRAGSRRARSSSTRSSCTATSPTSATCAAWPSTRRRRPTSSSWPTSRPPPGSPPTSCACRWASSRSTTSSPTSRPASGRRADASVVVADLLPVTGAWRPGDDPGRRQFATIADGLKLEAGGRLESVDRRLRDVGHAGA